MRGLDCRILDDRIVPLTHEMRIYQLETVGGLDPPQNSAHNAPK